MRKPPKNAQCDAHVGVDYSNGNPYLLRCPNKATKTMMVLFETWVCDSCYEVLSSKYPQKKS